MIMQEAKKNVSSDTGTPPIDQAVVNSEFPLSRYDWVFNTTEGKGHRKVYYQFLLAGFKGAAQ